jgi:hypothetical protein
MIGGASRREAEVGIEYAKLISSIALCPYRHIQSENGLEIGVIDPSIIGTHPNVRGQHAEANVRVRAFTAVTGVRIPLGTPIKTIS